MLNVERADSEVGGQYKYVATKTWLTDQYLTIINKIEMSFPVKQGRYHSHVVSRFNKQQALCQGLFSAMW